MSRKERPANGKQSAAPRTAAGFSKISIDNYRGIRHLEMEDLGQVNVIFGENNCGKTTVLEALAMLVMPTEIGAIVAVDNFRQFTWRYSNEDDMRFPFHQFSFDNPIRLTGALATGGERREINFHPFFENSMPQSTQASGGGSKNGITKNVKGLESAVSIHRGNKHDELTYRLRIHSSGEIRPEPSPENPPYEESLRVCAFPANAFLFSVEAIERLCINKQDSRLVEILQRIVNPAIKGIMPIESRIYLDLEGQGMRVPLNSMGSGTARIIDILARTLDGSNHVLLMDEFENGLFHTAIDNMWKPFFDFVRETNAQIFLTTHSHDLLKSLSGHLEGNGADSSLMSFYNLSRLPKGKRFPEGGHKAYRYDVESIIHNIEQGNEIRD